MTESDRAQLGGAGDRRLTRAARTDAERAERIRESRRQYREKYPERERAAKLRYRLKYPERHREQSRRSARRKKVRERRNAKAREKYRQNPAPERERLRKFHRDHPEKAAEYRRTFRGRHPERHLEQNRRASAAWRERNADKVREANRAAAAKRRQENPDAQREHYQANLERERARSRDRARLRRRLQALGLPPKKVEKVSAQAKRDNARAADEFFARPRAARAIKQLRDEAERPSGAELRARLKGAFEPTPQHLLMEWARDSVLARERLSAASQRRALWDNFVERNGPRIREEIRLDSRAREIRGRPPLDGEAEFKKRAGAEFQEQVLGRLDTLVKRRQAAFATPPSAAVSAGGRQDQSATPVPPTQNRRADRSR